jgi:hypothetical protein
MLDTRDGIYRRISVHGKEHFCDEAISIFAVQENRDCFVVSLLAMTKIQSLDSVTASGLTSLKYSPDEAE